MVNGECIGNCCSRRLSWRSIQGFCALEIFKDGLVKWCCSMYSQSKQLVGHHVIMLGLIVLCMGWDVGMLLYVVYMYVWWYFIFLFDIYDDIIRYKWLYMLLIWYVLLVMYINVNMYIHITRIWCCHNWCLFLEDPICVCSYVLLRLLIRHPYQAPSRCSNVAIRYQMTHGCPHLTGCLTCLVLRSKAISRLIRVK